MNKNFLFWFGMGILVVLLVGIWFLIEYEEVPIFEGNYSYVNAENETFVFSTSQKEGTEVVFHYVTLDRYDNRKRVHDYFTVALRNNPYSLEEIPMEDVGDNMYNGIVSKKFTYIVQDPFLGNKTDQATVTAAYQLGLNIGIKGFLKTNTFLRFNVEGYSENTAVNCGQVTENRAVIEYRLGEPSIYAEDGCVILQALDKEGFYKVTDKFVLHLGGVF